MFSLEYSEIQRQIQDAAKKFAEEEIAPSVLRRDKEEIFPTEIIKSLGELGFMGMLVSEDWDGSGFDSISYSLAMEEISKVDASVGIVVSVQNSLVNWIIENYGSDAQKEKYLKPLARGEKIGAYCLSEPEAGSDARSIQTSAELQDGYWVLNGMKNWISTAQNADIYIIFAQTNPERKHKGIAAFIVEKGADGLVAGPREDKIGMRSSDTCSLSMTNVKTPEDNVIDEVGQGFYIAMRGLNGGRIGIASQALGIAQGAFERAARYSKERKTFGKPICDHQAIQLKLAQMSMNINASRALVHKAAWLRDQKLDHIQASSEAKLFATTTAFNVAREAVQILGGYGCVREYWVEKALRDAKVTEIYEGTSEIQHIVIAREIINKL